MSPYVYVTAARWAWLVRQFLNFVQDQRIELVQLGWQVCNLPRRATNQQRARQHCDSDETTCTQWDAHEVLPPVG